MNCLYLRWNFSLTEQWKFQLFTDPFKYDSMQIFLKKNQSYQRREFNVVFVSACSKREEKKISPNILNFSQKLLFFICFFNLDVYSQRKPKYLKIVIHWFKFCFRMWRAIDVRIRHFFFKFETRYVFNSAHPFD